MCCCFLRYNQFLKRAKKRGALFITTLAFHLALSLHDLKRKEILHGPDPDGAFFSHTIPPFRHV